MPTRKQNYSISTSGSSISSVFSTASPVVNQKKNRVLAPSRQYNSKPQTDTIDENDTKTINRSSKAADSAAYSQLKTSSKNAISELKARIKELEGQLKESRKTVQKLSNIGADKLLTKLDTLLDKHPHIKRLTPITNIAKQAHKNTTQPGWKKETALTKNYLYFTDENGDLFPEEYRQQLFSAARGILTDAAVRTGYHHSNWRSNGRDFREHFIASIEEAYPTLAACEAHWKAIQVAQDHYPIWIKSFWRESVEVLGKQKQGGVTTGDGDQKRKLEDLDGVLPVGKRLKLELESSSTFSKIQGREIVNVFSDFTAHQEISRSSVLNTQTDRALQPPPTLPLATVTPSPILQAAAHSPDTNIDPVLQNPPAPSSSSTTATPGPTSHTAVDPQHSELTSPTFPTPITPSLASTDTITPPTLNAPAIVQPAPTAEMLPLAQNAPLVIQTLPAMPKPATQAPGVPPITHPTTAVGQPEFIFPDMTTALAEFGAFAAGLKAQETNKPVLNASNTTEKPVAEVDEGLKHLPDYWDQSEWFSKARTRKRKTYAVASAKITPEHLYGREWCLRPENKTRTPVDFANDYDNLPVATKILYFVQAETHPSNVDRTFIAKGYRKDVLKRKVLRGVD